MSRFVKSDHCKSEHATVRISAKATFFPAQTMRRHKDVAAGDDARYDLSGGQNKLFLGKPAVGPEHGRERREEPLIALDGVAEN